MEETPAVPRLILTEDGSHTLFRDDLGEPYHSVHGALQESVHVFINSGLHHLKKKDISILEVGFGTGLNALLTFFECARLNMRTQYTGIEASPLPPGITASLNYPGILQIPGAGEVLKKLHEPVLNCPVSISDCFLFTPVTSRLEDVALEPLTFDLVYFDAFAPEVQPELWTEEIFTRIGNSMKPGGILVTYCCKGSVKRALKTAGFTIEKLPGPPGKREMLRATKIQNCSAFMKVIIRVYGIFIEEDRLLVTDEYRLGMLMTKLPGGGLEPGEGLADCLRRECLEELGQEAEILEHFYTTDFFQPSMLLPEPSQIINVYYTIRLEKPFRFKTVTKRFDFDELTDGAQTFRWIPLAEMSPDDFDLPVDKVVAKMIKGRFDRHSS